MSWHEGISSHLVGWSKYKIILISDISVYLSLRKCIYLNHFHAISVWMKMLIFPLQYLKETVMSNGMN